MESLRDKHPERQNLMLNDLTNYESVPHIGFINGSDDTVESVANLLGGSGGRGMYTHFLQVLLLIFAPLSRKLQDTVSQLVSWIVNRLVPWAAIRGLMEGRLIALENIQVSDPSESERCGGD